VRKALSAPARQIAINAGEDGSVIVGKTLEKDQYNYGFDYLPSSFAKDERWPCDIFGRRPPAQDRFGIKMQ
jgi:chaperonin GroEL (HSP60 family)